MKWRFMQMLGRAADMEVAASAADASGTVDVNQRGIEATRRIWSAIDLDVQTPEPRKSAMAAHRDALDREWQCAQLQLALEVVVGMFDTLLVNPNGLSRKRWKETTRLLLRLGNPIRRLRLSDARGPARVLRVVCDKLMMWDERRKDVEEGRLGDEEFRSLDSMWNLSRPMSQRIFAAMCLAYPGVPRHPHLTRHAIDRKRVLEAMQQGVPNMTKAQLLTVYRKQVRWALFEMYLAEQASRNLKIAAACLRKIADLLPNTQAGLLSATEIRIGAMRLTAPAWMTWGVIGSAAASTGAVAYYLMKMEKVAG